MDVIANDTPSVALVPVALVRAGFARVVTIPLELGYITKLSGDNGRLVIETSSGIPMIIGVPCK